MNTAVYGESLRLIRRQQNRTQAEISEISGVSVSTICRIEQGNTAVSFESYVQVREELDFIIWLAHDRWSLMDKRQQRALLDHELCHCWLPSPEKPTIRPHDIEEFYPILQRHGYWQPGYEQLQEVVDTYYQTPFEALGGNGRVVAVDIVGGDVIE